MTQAVWCRAPQVSESWFYKWVDRTPTATERQRAEVDAAAERGLHGSPRIHADLQDEWVAGERENGGRIDGAAGTGRRCGYQQVYRL